MAMGLPIIADSNFSRLGVIDEYISFIWTSRYYSAGDFELYVPVDLKTAATLKVGNYVLRDDDENIGIIESIEADITEERQYTITAKGRFLPAILARRIIAVQTQVNGLLDESIYTLLDDAILAPVIEARKIDNFVIDKTAYTTEAVVEAQYTGKNLLEVISGLCQQYGVGFNVTYNGSDFVFALYQGTDRSYAQNVNPWVVFSDAYDNLLTSTYIEDESKKVTAALVAGEGEGLDRKTVWAEKDDPPAGLDRFELYVDSRNIRNNDGTKTDEQYLEQLREEGLEELTEYTTAFTGRVDFRNVQYKRDVFLGDICTIENKKMGMYVNARLVEVIESTGETGKYEVIPTFGI